MVRGDPIKYIHNISSFSARFIWKSWATYSAKEKWQTVNPFIAIHFSVCICLPVASYFRHTPKKETQTTERISNEWNKTGQVEQCTNTFGERRAHTEKAPSLPKNGHHPSLRDENAKMRGKFIYKNQYRNDDGKRNRRNRIESTGTSGIHKDHGKWEKQTEANKPNQTNQDLNQINEIKSNSSK